LERVPKAGEVGFRGNYRNLSLVQFQFPKEILLKKPFHIIFSAIIAKKLLPTCAFIFFILPNFANIKITNNSKTLGETTVMTEGNN